jgi:hypothetical protein
MKLMFLGTSHAARYPAAYPAWSIIFGETPGLKNGWKRDRKFVKII